MAEANPQTDTTAPAPAADATAAAPAVEAAAGATGAETAPAAEAPASEPSLLAGADVGKRDGAPEAPAAEAKPSTETRSAEPAKEPEAAKPDEGAEKTGEAAEGEKKPEAETSKGDEKKPDETSEKPEGDKKAEALAEEPPAPPKYDAFKLPEGFKADQKRLDAFTDMLGKTELAGKADHKAMQEFGQQLVDFHVEEMQRVVTELQKHQTDVWNRYKEGLINETKADPEVGGNRIETALGNAKYAFQNYLGLKPEQQTRLLQALDAAGVSDHPDFIRGLNNLYERLRPPGPVQPNLPSQESKPGQRSWYDRVDGATG